MNRIFFFVLFVYIFIGCVAKKVTSHLPIKPDSYTLIDSEINLDFKAVKTTFNDFDNSNNSVDIFYVDFDSRHNITRAKRILKAKMDSPFTGYNIINDSLVSIKLSSQITDEIEHFQDVGNYLIFEKNNILDYKLNVICVKKYGKTIFTMYNHSDHLVLKEEDLPKLNKGVKLKRLMELL